MKPVGEESGEYVKNAFQQAKDRTGLEAGLKGTEIPNVKAKNLHDDENLAELSENIEKVMPGTPENKG